MQHFQARAGISDGSRNENEIARFGARPAQHAARRDAPQRGDGKRQRSRRGGRIPAQKSHPVTRLVFLKPGGKASQPAIVDPVGQRKRQKVIPCLGALRGQIGKVHPERFLGDQIGGIIAQEMHAFDQRIHRHHKLFARRQTQRGGVVLEAERAFVLRRQGREQLRDQREFA